MSEKKCWWHKWVYRNPHDRTCKKCGRHENEFDNLGQYANGVVGWHSSWEEVY